MSPNIQSDTYNKRKPLNREAFGTITVLAVVIAVAMVLMGRANASPWINKLPPSLATPRPAKVTPLSSPGVTATPLSSPVVTPVSPQTPIDTSMGLRTAPITIIEYSEFQCSHCQQFAQTIGKELEETYVKTDKARIIYRFITAYDESLLANEAAACAAEQGQFWPYFELLMAQGASPRVPDLSVEKLESLASQLGLDMTQFKASLESGKYESLIWQYDDEGRALGVTGTPTFFVNGIKMEGARSLKDFSDIIEPLLQKSGNGE